MLRSYQAYIAGSIIAQITYFIFIIVVLGADDTPPAPEKKENEAET